MKNKKKHFPLFYPNNMSFQKRFKFFFFIKKFITLKLILLGFKKSVHKKKNTYFFNKT